jgi:hypothetical protein
VTGGPIPPKREIETAVTQLLAEKLSPDARVVPADQVGAATLFCDGRAREIDGLIDVNGQLIVVEVLVYAPDGRESASARYQEDLQDRVLEKLRCHCVGFVPSVVYWPRGTGGVCGVPPTSEHELIAVEFAELFATYSHLGKMWDVYLGSGVVDQDAGDLFRMPGEGRATLTLGERLSKARYPKLTQWFHSFEVRLQPYSHWELAEFNHEGFMGGLLALKPDWLRKHIVKKSRQSVDRQLRSDVKQHLVVVLSQGMFSTMLPPEDLRGALNVVVSVLHNSNHEFDCLYLDDPVLAPKMIGKSLTK